MYPKTFHAIAARWSSVRSPPMYCVRCRNAESMKPERGSPFSQFRSAYFRAPFS
jgi:hypothetical protein